MAICKPLYGHTSEDTAYLVPDYPYGRKVRCRIRYWLEQSPSKGFRFVSQTENPKTLRWNAPKKSTYVLLSACMYLDENDHVQWSCFHHGNPREALEYAQAFPSAPDLHECKAFVSRRIKTLAEIISGERYFTINSVRQPYSDENKQGDTEEKQKWEEVLKALPE